MKTEVSGEYQERFAPLVGAFTEGLEDGTDVGAALSVVVDGVRVVDIWGGHRDQDRALEWTRDTVCPVMSVGKAWLATCLLMLADAGAIDLDAPVARYWPEYAAAGKSGTLVQHVLTHTAGVPFHADLPSGADWAVHGNLARALEQQAPLWLPGSTPAYHPMVMGTLVDALVRRVAGQDVAGWFAEHVAGPRGIEAGFGRRGGAPRALAGPSPRESRPITDGCAADPRCRPAPGEPRRTYELVNSPAFERTEWPSINGFATARGVADVYAALIGTGGVEPLLDPARLDQATTPAWEACEASGGQYMRMGLGVNLGHTDSYWYGAGDSAFGHVGKGGSTGFGDRSRGVAFGYVTNSHYEGPGSGPQSQRLGQVLADLL
ncbi:MULTISPECIES: serine hydrolase domain-containing protein [unclassified Streptomyces]|uniref:serine hydrolase domain-containing protein n=1 Tax=unclassified Streptomyces TaxID=2593676 RepID=UPI002E2D4EEA|nr:serine hydrolase domain-containing protein [Streptomyces sp. NBC_00223]